MNIQVRYLSKAGNTQKIAEAIAKELGVTSETISKEISEKTDILFLGGAVYAAGIDNALKRFIEGLDKKVKKVAVFSTSAIIKSAFPEIRKLLQDRNIEVCENNFYCRGEFLLLHKNRPNEKDLKAARQFARDIISHI